MTTVRTTTRRAPFLTPHSCRPGPTAPAWSDDDLHGPADLIPRAGHPRRARPLRVRGGDGPAARRRGRRRAPGSKPTTGAPYIDFAGGIGCQNLGHGAPDVVRAIHEQVDRYLHQCFMVGMYEPYVEVCRRLAELYPAGARYRERAAQLGRGGGRERGQDRARRHRAPGCDRVRSRVPRRTLLTMSLTSKVTPYKTRLRAVRAGGLPRAGALRVPRHRFRRGDRGAGAAVRVRRRSAQRRLRRCSSRCRARAASCRCPRDFPRRLKELCSAHGILYVDDEVQAGVAGPGRCGRSSTTASPGPARLRQVARRRPPARRRHGPRPSDGRRPPAVSAARSGATRSPAPPPAVVLEEVASPRSARRRKRRRARARAAASDSPLARLRRRRARPRADARARAVHDDARRSSRARTRHRDGRRRARARVCCCSSCGSSSAT